MHSSGDWIFPLFAVGVASLVLGVAILAFNGLRGADFRMLSPSAGAKLSRRLGKIARVVAAMYVIGAITAKPVKLRVGAQDSWQAFEKGQWRHVDRTEATRMVQENLRRRAAFCALGLTIFAASFLPPSAWKTSAAE